MSTAKEFAALQWRWRRADSARADFVGAMAAKYHDPDRWHSWCLRSERARHETLCARERAAGNAFLGWLYKHSPRGQEWGHGAPVVWLCWDLTYADALTSGPLSVTPPLCYGQTARDQARFLAPVGAEVTR